MSDSRSLGYEEARTLLRMADAERLDKERKEEKWPGSYNLGLLAKAVDERKQFVEFEPSHMRFIIRYEERYKSVFVQPADRTLFVPCGYFSYDKLKSELNR